MIVKVKLPASLVRDLRTLAKERKLPLLAYIEFALRERTIGMHITARSLRILRKAIKFERFA